MAASTYFAQVQQLYIAYFGRPADPTGQAYWAANIDAAKGDISAVIAGFSASKESSDLFGNKSTIDKVTAIYQNAFGRAPEPAGLAYWVAQLDSGKVSQAQASWTIQQNAGPGDAAAVQNKLTAAQAFTAQIDTTAEVEGYQGAAAAQVARDFLKGVTADNATATAAVAAAAAAVSAATAVGNVGTAYTLTTGIDNLVGDSGNNTFTGVYDDTAASRTLNAGDSINGGAGVDTLKVIVANAATAVNPLTGVTITNVEKLTVQNVSVSATNINAATISGLTSVSSQNSTGAVNFTGLAAGTEVLVAGAGQTDAVNFQQAVTTDAVKVTLAGNVNGVSISASAGTATSAVVNSTVSANGTVTADTIKLTGGTNTLTALTVNATTDLTAVLTAADFAATAALTVTGAGKVNLGDKFSGSTINASTNTGGLTISTTDGVTSSLIGSAGNDVVTLVGTLAAAGSINLGAGNDKLLATTGAVIAAGNIIDGGAGIDSISASLINAANAANIKNFEQLDLSAATVTPLDLDLVTGSAITGLTLNGAGGATLTNVAAGVGLSVEGSSTGVTTIGVKGAVAGTADSFSISFDSATAVAAVPTAANVAVNSVVLNGVETVNIASKGAANTWNSIGLTDSNLQTLNITGDKNLDVTFAGTNGTNVTAGGGGVKLIDGSTATGKLNINTTNVTADNKAGVGLTINGGSASDTITLGQKATVVAGAGDDTIVSAAAGGTFTGGAGADKFNVALAVATGATEATSVLSTITDFSKTDSIVFGASAATFASTKVVLDASVTNLDQALAAAATVAGQVSWFQYGANTYVVANDASAAFGAGDTVVKLSGLVDLSTSGFNATTHALTA